jgi:DNA-binding LytR/AlgR family response regulator
LLRFFAVFRGSSLTALDFVRIERSLLVNFRHVAFAERLGRGMFALTLRNGRRLTSSLTYRGAILEEMHASQPRQ